MTEERLKVLEILQDGKINAEEASRLLEALNKTPQDDENLEVQIEEAVAAQIDEDIEAQIEKEVEAEVDEDVKMKIKVKMNQNEDV